MRLKSERQGGRWSKLAPVDCVSNAGSLVGRQVVHGDEVALREVGNEHLLDIGQEDVPVHGSAVGEGRGHPGRNRLISCHGAERLGRVRPWQEPVNLGLGMTDDDAGVIAASHWSLTSETFHLNLCGQCDHIMVIFVLIVAHLYAPAKR